MNHDNHEKLNVPITDAQAGYLQRLGLKTLLTDKFQPTARAFWAGLIKYRLMIGAVLLTSIFAGLLGGFITQTHRLNQERAQYKARVGQKQDLTLQIAALQSLCDKLKADRTLVVEFKDPPADYSPGQIEKLSDVLMGEADVNARHGGYQGTILHFAAKLGVDISTIKELVEMGADPNAQQNMGVKSVPIPNSLNGMTPLMMMIYQEKYDLAVRFITNVEGVDINIGTKHGRTALKMCIQIKKERMSLKKGRNIPLERLILTLTQRLPEAT